VEYTSRPLLDQGDINGAVVTFKDISEREFLEKQVRQAQKLEAIGTLAGGIAHDFNNILSAVIGFTQVSLLDVPEGSKLGGNLNQVLQAAERARDLVKQIMAFSRQDDSERQPVELHRLVKEMLKLMRATLPATIEMRSAVQPAGLIMADPTQIHQVLINILTNAAQAIGVRKGLITVTLDDVVFEADGPLPHGDLKPGRYQCLTVGDTGPGIDPEVRDRIFDPFFTTKAPGEGNGLGLSVSFGIVRKHGGTITVASEPARGTTIRVYLPLLPKMGTIKTSPPKKPTNSRGRILLIDDEASLIDVGQLMLERAGYDVTALTDPQEALRAFKAHPENFDLVITDQTMPGLTGEELARKIFILRPDIPVVLCTGYSEGLTEQRIEVQGIRKLLFKPLEMQEFLETVQRLLSGPAWPVPAGSGQLTGVKLNQTALSADNTGEAL
jgi:nitrogen-specific signal transduction histidine kinase/ActR/RegA family two-component response regulator